MKYLTEIPKNKFYIIYFNKKIDSDESGNKKYNLLLEFTIPLFYESVLNKFQFDLMKKFDCKISGFKDRYPNITLFTYCKSSDKLKISKFIAEYFKFINKENYKEALEYPKFIHYKICKTSIGKEFDKEFEKEIRGFNLKKRTKI